LANPYFVCAFLNLEYGKKMLFNHTQVIWSQCNFSPLIEKTIFVPPIELQNIYEHRIKIIKKHKLKLQRLLKY
jgi:hypothetical protein